MPRLVGALAPRVETWPFMELRVLAAKEDRVNRSHHSADGRNVKRPVGAGSLARDAGIYLAGRVITGIASLAAIAIFTRTLSADEYGVYSLIVAASGATSAILFQWIGLSGGRLILGATDERTVLSTVLQGYVLVATVVGILGVGAAVWVRSPHVRAVLLLTAAVTVAQAWFDLNLKIANSRFAAGRYGVVAALRSIISISAGAALACLGLGVTGVALGLVAASVVSTLLLTAQWRGVPKPSLQLNRLRAFFAYGAPLTVTFTMTMILDVSDRFLLRWYTDDRRVAAYSAAYDIAQQALVGVLGVVHLAAYPRTMNALERSGWDAAREQLQRNLLVLTAIGVPAATGLWLLSGNISRTLIGAAIREQAALVVPVVAAGVLIGGVKAYYVDYAFHLARKTTAQVWPIAGAAALNVALNTVWIPRYGTLGAAYATLVAYAASLGLGVVIARRIIRFPRFHPDLYKVGVAAALMGASIWPMRNARGAAALTYQVGIGAAVYGSCLLALNVAQLRDTAKQALRRYGASRRSFVGVGSVARTAPHAAPPPRQGTRRTDSTAAGAKSSDGTGCGGAAET